jgi:hypothetical protein
MADLLAGEAERAGRRHPYSGRYLVTGNACATSSSAVDAFAQCRSSCIATTSSALQHPMHPATSSLGVDSRKRGTAANRVLTPRLPSPIGRSPARDTHTTLTGMAPYQRCQAPSERTSLRSSWSWPPGACEARRLCACLAGSFGRSTVEHPRRPMGRSDPSRPPRRETRVSK